MKRVASTTALIWFVTLTSPAFAADEPTSNRKEDVIYGRKFGMALTMDVFTPRKDSNHRGVVFVVSGGWFSAHEAIARQFVEPLVRRGYTVFAVVHGSQPKFTIPEILQDMNRAVRFIRHHADDYGIAPDRLGIYGGSAGGHLSLMQGTAGDEGDPKAKDPVDRESSRVQAVACFFPPTDFLNYGKPGVHALGRGILENFRAPFDFHELDTKRNQFVPVVDDAQILTIGRRISPINQVSSDDPPTLIIHGDADKLVPIQQAEMFVEKLKASGVEAKLVTKPGAAHGWGDMGKDIEQFADWFDEHLKARKDEGGRSTTAPGAQADQPPRKVVVGTAIFGPYGEYPGLDERLKVLGGLIDEMAKQAETKYPGHGLDLAVLPETTVTSMNGPATSRAIRLDGPVRETFRRLARKYKSYLVVPMDLAEEGPKGTMYSNAAVLFDRKGEVAGIYRKAHPVAILGTDELEGGITPGRAFPVFECDFGRLGVQICWDVQFEDGWETLARKGAELVVWPTASPATA
jgi:acetyl esterase/lipase